MPGAEAAQEDTGAETRKFTTLIVNYLLIKSDPTTMRFSTLYVSFHVAHAMDDALLPSYAVDSGPPAPEQGSCSTTHPLPADHSITLSVKTITLSLGALFGC